MNLNQIDSCFGVADAIFAGHPADEERAFELLKYCRENNISVNDVLNEAEKYLKSKTTYTEHINQQLDKIKKMYSPWL